MPHPLTDITKTILCCTFRALQFSFHASTNKCTQLSLNSQRRSKNIQFLHVSNPAGPPSGSTLHCSALNTTNISTRPSTLLTILFTTHMQSTRKNPTNSFRYSTDQIAFINCFTQQCTPWRWTVRSEKFRSLMLLKYYWDFNDNWVLLLVKIVEMNMAVPCAVMLNKMYVMAVPCTVTLYKMYAIV